MESTRTIPRLKKPQRGANPFSKSNYIKSLYNTPQWKNLRLYKLQNNPLCERCESKGRTEVATEVHHIKPISTGNNKYECEELTFDYSNLQSVCSLCHIKIHKELKKQKQNHYNVI